MGETAIREAPRWVRSPGMSLLGPVQGASTPSFLVRRADGQVVQLSQLLHTVVTRIDPRRRPDEIADSVSSAYGKTLTTEGLAFLVENKLRPLGLVQDVGASPDAATVPVSRPLLSLGLRGTLIPAHRVVRLGALLAPLFHPVVVVLAVAALVVMDVRLLTRGDVMLAFSSVLATPALLLGLYALSTLGSIIHELGHAAGCSYSGGVPGRIGFGVYLLVPAFFTNVTDSYRLSRAGRLRTDLGGLYFNTWCLLVAGAVHLTTGSGLALLFVVLTHVEMVQQLLPAIRLDGYFILTDLTGVPDLFARIGPVLRGMLPGRPMDPRLAQLRRRIRWVVTAWVLAVVPLLGYGLVWLVLNFPKLVGTTVTAMAAQWQAGRAAWMAGELLTVALAAISLVLLTIPLAGLGVVAVRMVQLLVRLAGRILGRPTPALATSAPAGPPQQPAPVPAAAPAALTEPDPRPEPATEGAPDPYAVPFLHGLTADEFSPATVLGRSRRMARTGWRHTVNEASGGRLALPPSTAEQRRDALLARVRAPIAGTRRVVVMSRKGGVGKTTITVGLGATFATRRGDRVVAVDANPDAGNLAQRIAGDCPRTITDLLTDLDDIRSFSRMRQYTSQCSESRLEVLASDDDARISQGLGRRDYEEVVSLLDHYYNLILLDTGTGILDSANQGLLGEADQLVLVVRPALDGARAGAQTLDWLDEHGYAELVSTAVVVMNGVARENDPVVAFARKHFEQRCTHVTLVPWDRALETGARTTLSSMSPQTREAFEDIAAALADRFSEVGRGLT